MSNPSGTFERDAYSVDEFCRRVGISRPTFYRLRAAKKLNAVKLGGRTLVPATEIARIFGGQVA